MINLVTIVVTTYNASSYIIETLESTFYQSYSNLALVISDDCSSDSTVAIVRDWVAQKKNQKRFSTIKILTVPKNTGVSANCNRCMMAVKTDWFKFISGDDILLPNCIEDNMNFVKENPQAKIVFSQVKLYQDYFQEINYITMTPEDYPINLMNPSLSAGDQYKLLLLSDRINYTPSVFMNKEAILKVGEYDESNRLVEDYPMWLKLTVSGERLYYFHKKTVGYRVHAKATNNVGDAFIFSPSILNAFEIRKKFAHPNLPWEIVASEYQVHWISILFKQLGWNKKTKNLMQMYRLGSFYLNPFHYVYAIKKRLPYNKNNPFYSQ